MDEKKTIIDITSYLDSQVEKKQEKTTVPSFQSNPILKKFMVINAKNTKGKFSIKDLFR